MFQTPWDQATNTGIHATAVPIPETPRPAGSSKSKANTTQSKASLWDKALTRGFPFRTHGQTRQAPAAHPDLSVSVPRPSWKGQATLRYLDSTVNSTEGHSAMDLAGVCLFLSNDWGQGAREGAGQREVFYETPFNWIQTYLAFSLQGTALASQGRRQDRPAAREGLPC